MAAAKELNRISFGQNMGHMSNIVILQSAPAAFLVLIHLKALLTPGTEKVISLKGETTHPLTCASAVFAFYSLKASTKVKSDSIGIR